MRLIKITYVREELKTSLLKKKQNSSTLLYKYRMKTYARKNLQETPESLFVI